MLQPAGRRAAHLLDMMHLLHKSVQSSLVGSALQLKDHLTLAQVTVLGMIRDKGPANMRTLAACNQVAMPTMSEMITRLVKCGLVKRLQDRQDRRVVQVTLTAKGERLLETKYKLAQTVTASLLKGLNDKEQEQMLKAFQTITRLLEKSNMERIR